MAQVVSVRIEDHSEEVIEEMKQKVQAWLLAVGEDAASTAANDPPCPVDTGRLRNSITAVTATGQSPANTHGGASASASDYAPHATPEENEVYIGTNVPYAEYQEFGTSKIPAKHFLQFGATAHKNE